MGSIQFPTTLSGWGRYCDCLENIQRFRVQQPEISQSQEIQNEKALDVPSYTIKSKGQKNLQPPTAQSIETPPPMRHQHKNILKKQKHAGPLMLKKLGQQTIQQISQLSDMHAVKDNIFDIVRLEQDEDIKNNRNIAYLNTMNRSDEQKIRATVPNPSDNCVLDNQRANNTSYTSKNGNRAAKKYFLDEKDKEQYLNHNKFT